MIGTRLSGRYQIEAELGRGGMGVVYRAHDPQLGRDVAVKLVHPALLTAASQDQLLREAQVVARMDHPAIVPVHDIGRHDGGLFLVMPLLPGGTLRSLLRERALEVRDAVEVAAQVAEALDYSHALGVVHRDVKPENVMVARDEQGRLRARVMDFGLAGDPTASASQAETVMGSATYLSPEQVLRKPVDGRTDVYALGTVLYESLTGQPPFRDNLTALFRRIAEEPPRPPAELRPEVDEELQALVLRCLAKDPQRRPPRAADVAEGLYRWLAGRADEESPTSGLRIAPLAAAERFIGRARELETLLGRLERARTVGAQLALVSGEPGIGKTRLLEELDARARAARVRVLRGHFVDRDRGFPYQGLCEVIQDHFRRHDPPPPAAALEFSDLAAPLRALFPVLSEIAELRRAPGRAARAPRDSTEVFELLARALLRMAGERPLVLLLEDLHEADASIDALRYILRRLGAAPVLMVATYRSTEAGRHHPLRRLLSDLGGDSRVEEVPLRPFSAPETRELLEWLLGGPVAGPALESVQEASEGNPLFARELVRALREREGLAQDRDGLWALADTAGVGPPQLPPTIQQTVQRRLQGLAADLRRVVDAAAVLGRTFAVADLRPLVEAADLDDALERLIAFSIVQEEGGTRGRRLAFASGVLRDVLYSGLARKKRRGLHRRHAEDLERRHAGRLERVYPQLVHHFSQADVAEKTVEYGLLWARRSLPPSARATRCARRRWCWSSWTRTGAASPACVARRACCSLRPTGWGATSKARCARPSRRSARSRAAATLPDAWRRCGCWPNARGRPGRRRWPRNGCRRASPPRARPARRTRCGGSCRWPPRWQTCAASTRRGTSSCRKHSGWARGRAATAAARRRAAVA